MTTQIRVFHTRKIEEANRAAALLAEAGIAHTRSRIVGDVEVAMPDLPEDALTVSWLVKVPPESREEAQQVLAGLIGETGAKPALTWIGPVYLLALIAMVIALSVQMCR